MNITNSMLVIGRAMKGGTLTKISYKVTSFGATDLSQIQAGPKGGERK